MKAIEIVNDSNIPRLHLVKRGIPLPGAGEVLIRIQAAGVNRADILQVKGLYPPPPGASDIPGMEVSGTIAAMGEGVTGFAEGEEVCALLPGGGYAEYATAQAGQVLPLPHSMDTTAAAALPEACFTVWKNLYSLAQLKPGERVLIHAGASGIGTTAIQIASALGAEVYTTAGNAEKCRICEEIGATKAIDYTQEDYALALEPFGVDVILDVLGGGADFQKNLSLLAYKGRMVTIALLSGKNASANLAPILLKNLTLFGSTLRSDTAEAKASIAKELQSHVWPLYARGAIKPIIDSTFPLEDAEAAHHRMESRQHVGKIVLRCI